MLSKQIVQMDKTTTKNKFWSRQKIHKRHIAQKCLLQTNLKWESLECNVDGRYSLFMDTDVRAY